jgi:Flp pilus assembly protein TadG
MRPMANSNRPPNLRLTRRARGQAMAEFALIVPLFVTIIFVAITFAVIGQAALAVSQLAFAGARYAAVNSTQSKATLQSYISSGALGSPTITGNSGKNLTVTVTPATGFGQPVTVTVSYDLTSNTMVSTMSKLFSNLHMAMTFPSTLRATQSAMSE